VFVDLVWASRPDFRMRVCSIVNVVVHQYAGKQRKLDALFNLLQVSKVTSVTNSIVTSAMAVSRTLGSIKE
jgi:hypothetical protein